MPPETEIEIVPVASPLQRISVIAPTEITESASALVLIHNHPSGDPTPSTEDKHITQRLVSACKLVGIKPLDHIVIGKNQYYSFAEQGLI